MPYIQRANVKFCVRLVISATRMLHTMQQVYGDAAMNRAKCFDWHAHLKSIRTSPEHDERVISEIQRKSQKVLDTLREVDPRLHSRSGKTALLRLRETILKVTVCPRK
ncbi:hypothetical protein AVEN_263552-1 [Araneus ventricosus]|uniref:Mos1 transposase HTH domain-containing protein n=1 Tax=Araneus ventricosus TaxID=182803 RepID=A0A4Y2JX14_ARAVE|nr:hypothetical protein AVEN_263552-1 [Araneus ventricosus]